MASSCFVYVGLGATSSAPGGAGTNDPPAYGVSVTQSTAGGGPAGGPGVFGFGGNGGSGGETRTGGGGGGGGYYGGGGGGWVDGNLASSVQAGGGGGSGYISPSLTNTSQEVGGGAQTDDDQYNGYAAFEYTADQLTVNSTQTGVDGPEASQGVCNSTPTLATVTCTLAQAIAVSNDTGGATIDFDIPSDPADGNTFDDGLPQIQQTSATAVLDITAPTFIDGTTQPGVGKVELSGEVSYSSVVPGLVVGMGGGGSTIKGMVINGFQEMIVLQGGGNTIEDDWLGTNVAGSAADATPLGLPHDKPEDDARLPVGQVAVRVESSGNQIGAPGAGNVLASGYTGPDSSAKAQQPYSNYGLFGAGEIDDTAGGNEIQGNWIGLAKNSSTPLLGPVTSTFTPLGIEGALSLSGAADTVGGSAAGDGNVIAGGGTIDGAGSVLQGNTITDGGLGDHQAVDTPDPLNVTGVVTVGGPTTTPGQNDGNEFESVDSLIEELAISGSGTVVEGNLFRDDQAGAILDAGTDVTIGGASDFGVGNLIEHDGGTPEPMIQDDAGAIVPDTNPDALGLLEAIAAIRVAAKGGDHSLIEHNDFENNPGAGAVSIEAGTGATVTDNVMRGNARGITFQGVYDFDGVNTPGSGPNGYQYYPQLIGAYTRDDGLLITGRLAGIPALGGTYQVELYSQPSCESDFATPGEGEHYLGAQHLYAVAQPIPHPLGVLFSLHFPAAAAGDRAITATATAPDGSTSEFSPCLTIGHHSHSFKTVGVTPTAATIPVTIMTTTKSAKDAAIRVATVAKAKPTSKVTSAHGTLSLFCPPSTTGYCQGTFALGTSGKAGRQIAAGPFKILPGDVHAVTLTITGTLLATLGHAHRVRVVLKTTAHDGSKPPEHKNTTTRITLSST